MRPQPFNAKKMRLGLLTLAILASVSFSGKSMAAVMTETLDTGYLSTDLNTSLNLTLFNSQLGTLTGVTITETGYTQILSGSSVTSTATGTNNFTVSEQVLFNTTGILCLNAIFLNSRNVSVSGSSFSGFLNEFGK